MAVVEVAVCERVVDYLYVAFGSRMPNLAVVNEQRSKERMLHYYQAGSDVALEIASLMGGQPERPRTRHQVCQHCALAWSEIPTDTVSAKEWMEQYYNGQSHTSTSDGRDVIRSCCRVLSTEVCFWKVCREFEEPHKASAMVDVTLRYLEAKGENREDV